MFWACSEAEWVSTPSCVENQQNYLRGLCQKISELFPPLLGDRAELVGKIHLNK